MCFSATASFSAGAILLGLGTLTLKAAKRPRELPFAAVPLLFAIQQLSEGVIWLTFSYEAPQLNAIMTYVYSVFSHVLWPIYVPVAVLSIEPSGWRRRALFVFVAAGAAVGLYLLYFLIASPIVSRPVGQHIEYVSPHFFVATAMTLYLMSTTLSLFLSTHRMVVVFGGLVLLSFAAAYLFYATWFISVWCFFAALLSAIVYLHFAVRGTTRFAARRMLSSAESNPNAAEIVRESSQPRDRVDPRVRPSDRNIVSRRAAPSGVPLSTMAVLMLSVFTVSMGYSVVLPLLPYLIERLLGTTGDTAQIARSTGLLTGLYMLSLFLFAPLWGRLSDQHGRRAILLIGLIGFGTTMLTFGFMESLPAVYAERFLSGMFAAAVTPVAMAAIGDLAVNDESRARRLTFISLAGISGFLIGPMFGAFIARGAANMAAGINAIGSITLPLAITAILALLVAVAAFMTVPKAKRNNVVLKSDLLESITSVWIVPRLLFLAFVVSAGVGVFEVALAIRGKQELGLTQTQIALMFTECSLVMFIVQGIVFSPWVKPAATRWFVAPALAVLAAGIFLVSRTSDYLLMLVVIGAVAASAGILAPILTYWISSKSRKAQGAELGKHTAAASLGAAVGSGAGGILFDVAPLPDISILLMTMLAALGFLMSLGLPSRLVGRELGAATSDSEITKANGP